MCVTMLTVLFLFCSFQISSTVISGSHSLLVYSTFIIGDTPFPEFSAVVMLDDIQLAYYDLNVNRLIYRQSKMDSECIRQEDGSFIFEAIHIGMKEKALYFKHQHNLTHGIHVLQNLGGCELLNNGTTGSLRSFHAFSGVNTALWQFSTQKRTLHVEGLWNYFKGSVERLIATIYSPICIKALKNCLHTRQNDVMKKVKPRVRLLQKTLPDSGGAKVTCLATGFYPRHINLTLFRDGQSVSDHRITGAELLPNLDGTYQMRKSLEVSAEELRQKHNYSCTAEHRSLDNKLDINLDLEPGVSTVSVVIPVVLLGVAVLCVIGAIFMCCRRHSSSSDYTAAQRTDQDQHLHQLDQSAN